MLLVLSSFCLWAPARGQSVDEGMSFVQQQYPQLTELFHKELTERHVTYTFAIDVSGTMRQFAPIVQPALKQFVAALPDGDYVRIIRFGTTAKGEENGYLGEVSSSFKQDLYPAIDNLYNNVNDDKQFRAHTDIPDMGAAVCKSLLNSSDDMNFVFILTDFRNDQLGSGEHRLTTNDIKTLREKFEAASYDKLGRIVALQLPVNQNAPGYCLDQLRDGVFKNLRMSYEMQPVTNETTLRNWFIDLKKKIMVERLRAIVEEENRMSEVLVDTRVDVDGYVKAHVQWEPGRLYKNIKIDTTYVSLPGSQLSPEDLLSQYYQPYPFVPDDPEISQSSSGQPFFTGNDGNKYFVGDNGNLSRTGDDGIMTVYTPDGKVYQVIPGQSTFYTGSDGNRYTVDPRGGTSCEDANGNTVYQGPASNGPYPEGLGSDQKGQGGLKGLIDKGREKKKGSNPEGNPSDGNTDKDSGLGSGSAGSSGSGSNGYPGGYPGAYTGGKPQGGNPDFNPFDPQNTNNPFAPGQGRKGAPGFYLDNNGGAGRPTDDPSFDRNLGRIRNTNPGFHRSGDDLNMFVDLPTPYDNELKKLGIKKPVPKVRVPMEGKPVFTFFLPLWLTLLILLLSLIYLILLFKCMAENKRAKYRGEYRVFNMEGEPLIEPRRFEITKKGTQTFQGSGDQRWKFAVSKVPGKAFLLNHPKTKFKILPSNNKNVYKNRQGGVLNTITLGSLPTTLFYGSSKTNIQYRIEIRKK